MTCSATLTFLHSAGPDADGLITLNLDARALPELEAETIPDWIHLLPLAADGMVQTRNDVGPFPFGDAAKIIQRSFSEAGKLPVDENHSTDLAAPMGGPSPAVGWIVEMEARADGIWGRVEWNSAGKRLLEERAYSAISPVTLHDGKTKTALAILRASLVNTPNLRGLTALNANTKEVSGMDWKAHLIEALGLAGTADDEEIKAALKDKLQSPGGKPVKAAMSELAKLAGLEEDAEPQAVVTAVNNALANSADETEVTALQSRLNDVTTELNTLKDTTARTAAEAFVDGAIQDRRVGLNGANRKRYIERHMADPAATEADINDMPKLGATATTLEPPKPKDGAIALNSAQAEVARNMGISPEDYAKTLEAERTAEEAG